LQYVIISNWLTLKKSILAAIAAICLSGNALAAPPADFLSDIHTARQAIEHEMARRMDPGKGKPIRLDQPSTQQPTAAEKTALKAVFGTEQPLTVKRSGAIGKTTHYSATLPAIDYHTGDTRVTWPEANWHYSVRGNTVDNTVRWPGFDVYRPDFQFNIHDINTASTQTRGTSAEQVQLQVGSIKFQEIKGSGSALAEAVALRAETHEKNKKLDQHIALSLKRLSFGNGVALGDLHLDLRLRDINAVMWKQLSDAADIDQDTTIRSLLKPLMLQGARLELDDLSTSFGGDTLRLRGDIGMPGVTPRDLSTVEGAFNAVEAHLHVELPLATLRSFAMVATHHKLESDGEQVLDQQAQETYSYLLGKIIADGYARLEKDKLIAEIEIKRGQITINGRAQPYSLIQLLAMLHKQDQENQQPPEEDHSPPIALLWRDRPLEQVQLFGINGERFATQELCRRYAQAHDTEQAQRWCAKADLPVPDQAAEDHEDALPDAEDRTIHDTAEAGYYNLRHFHFDANKTRSMTVKLSNPQVHETWVAGMTICISADVPSDRACLVLAKYKGLDRVRVASHLYSTDNRALGEEHVLEQQLPLGEPVKLKIYVDNKQAHFVVAGKDLVQDVTFSTSVISLMCSTADCDFTFD
jgi:hypothetical protein